MRISEGCDEADGRTVLLWRACSMSSRKCMHRAEMPLARAICDVSGSVKLWPWTESSIALRTAMYCARTSGSGFVLSTMTDLPASIPCKG